MNAPVPEMIPAEDATAEALLGSLKSITAAERRKHASVFNYWLSIRGKRSLPPIRDLDPLEIADAGPVSLLLEVIGGGDDAVIRHIGQAIKAGDCDHISEAPSASLLATVAAKLPIVAATRQPFAFEEEFEGQDGPATCWVTLLPFSQSGTWIDYVYGFVSLDPAPDSDGEQPVESQAEIESEPEVAAEVEPEPIYEPDAVTEAETYVEAKAVPSQLEEAEPEEEPIAEAPKPRSTKGRAGFSAKFFESLASVGGFYGTTVDLDPETASLPEPDTHWSDPEPDPGIVAEVEPEPNREPEDVPQAEIVPEPVAFAAAEPEAEPEPVAEVAAQPEQLEVSAEGTLQTKLSEVRAKADEARAAKLRANAALYEGLSAVYDFALDAEDEPEEYLKLVEGKGLKIQLRSPMKPVVRLAFDGMCDDATIGQLEAVLAWALKNDLPRGSLAERIESEGGIAPIIGMAKAA
jgi:hypothetical protein